MKAVGVFPASREVRLVDHPAPVLEAADDVEARVLEVGACGTDREICAFEFGEPPVGRDYLVLGHEGLAEVTRVGKGVSRLKPGDLVVPMVRLPCEVPACAACRRERQDFCLTDTFPEHGIRRAHGFMTEAVVERERFLVPVPRALRDVAVLVEPLTIAEKALFQAADVQKRLPYPPGRKAVVLGAGPVGLLGAMALITRGYETFVFARSPGDTPNARLATSIGASYVSGGTTDFAALAKRLGGIDLVYEAAGAVKPAFELLEHLGTNGLFVMTGVPALTPVSTDVAGIMRNVVLKNQAVIGTVNAGRDAFEAAIRDLEVFLKRWPEALRGLITGRFRLDDFRRLLLEKPAGIKSIFVC
ncbi:MAG TPA: glucose 1-dehydrogenase [Planctomycetota bacterium]